MKKLFVVCVAAALVSVSCNNQQSSNGAVATGDSLASPVPIAEGSIVYVNIDSLTANYLMSADMRVELEDLTKKLDAEMGSKQRKFQKDVADFQNKAQKGLETRAKLAEMEQQLQADQQSLLAKGDEYRGQIAEEASVRQRKVLQSIMDYLKEYNSDRRYQYILANSFGGNVLYVDTRLDITASVLEGINAKYKSEKANKK